MGGAIDTGSLSYVHFLVPGFVVTSVLFTGATAAAGMAEDSEHGVIDRFLSLPVSRTAMLTGRVLAETVMLIVSLAITTAIGFAVGFRIQGSAVEALAAFGLIVAFGFAFMWVFTWMGQIAGNAQAAEGMSMLIFPVSFVSSAMVPVDTMPGWLQPVAENQPVTVMVNAVRSLVLGGPEVAGLGHSTRALGRPRLDGRHHARLRSPRRGQVPPVIGRRAGPVARTDCAPGSSPTTGAQSRPGERAGP